MPTYEYTDQNEIIPAKLGITEFEVVGCENKISQNSGNPMLVVECRQIETGASIRENLVFIPSAFWKIDVFLKACGFAFQKGQKVDVNEQLLKGRRFSAEVYEELYTKQDGTEGKAARIRNLQPVTGQSAQQAAAPAQQAPAQQPQQSGDEPW